MKRSLFIVFSFLALFFLGQHAEKNPVTTEDGPTIFVNPAVAAEISRGPDVFEVHEEIPDIPDAPISPPSAAVTISPSLAPARSSVTEFSAAENTQQGPRLVIPSIDLDALIIDVGINEKGEMDVPSGKGSDVGWYKFGTKPGEVGSAVIDAHVYAAFARLREVKEGDDIYVVSKEQTLHFKAHVRVVYPLSDVPRDLLFERSDARRLNLITCAGELTEDRSTYDHRLIVYAVLVETENE